MKYITWLQKISQKKQTKIGDKTASLREAYHDLTQLALGVERGCKTLSSFLQKNL